MKFSVCAAFSDAVLLSLNRSELLTLANATWEGGKEIVRQCNNLLNQEYTLEGQQGAFLLWESRASRADVEGLHWRDLGARGAAHDAGPIHGNTLEDCRVGVSLGTQHRPHLHTVSITTGLLGLG